MITYLTGDTTVIIRYTIEVSCLLSDNLLSIKEKKRVIRQMFIAYEVNYRSQWLQMICGALQAKLQASAQPTVHQKDT